MVANRPIDVGASRVLSVRMTWDFGKSRAGRVHKYYFKSVEQQLFES